MKKSDILGMVDLVEEYMKNASIDEITGRFFRLSVDLEKADKDNTVSIALELSLMTAFVEEK